MLERLHICDQVTVNMKIIESLNRSIRAYPSSSFVNKIRNFENSIWTITHTFEPSYDYTVQFEDNNDARFHVKIHWLNKV